MNQIILYGSKYGTAKEYAEELARKTNIEVQEFEDIDDINIYETIVYIGALYAGGVLGMKKTFNKLSNYENKKIIIVTVGLADPHDEKNEDNIKNGIKKQLNGKLYENASIFHLRGAIDYSKLNLKHKTMMKLLYKKAKGLPEEEKTAEVKAMIETYDKKVSFVDFNDLNAIIKII